MDKIWTKLEAIFELNFKSKICSILILANIEKSVINAYLPNYISKEETLSKASQYDDKSSMHKIFPKSNPPVNDIQSESANNINNAYGGFDLFYKNPYLRLIIRASTISHCVIVLHGIAIISMTNGLFGLDKQSSCYLLGRLQAITQAAESLPYIQIVISIFESKWRYNTMKLSQSFLDCIPFLLRDETNLMIQLRHDLGEEGAGKQQRWWKKRKQGLLYKEAGHKFASAKWPIDNYLKDILHLKLDLNDNNIQMNLLRPNRTLESRKRLAGFLNRLVRINLWLCAFVLTISTPIIAPNLIFDRYHVAYYPGCYRELEKSSEEGRLGLWSTSFFRDGYRFCNLLADSWINTFVWADSGFGTFSIGIISSLLMEDLIIYWSAIRKNLELLLDKMRLEDSQQKVVARSKVRVFIEHHSDCHGEQSEMNKDEMDGIHELESSSNEKHLQYDFESDKQKLNLEVEILQHQIIDFFNLLRKYDKFVSLYTTSLFEFWVLVIVATSYVAINLDKFEVLVQVRLVQVITVLLLLLALSYMPRVSHETKRAYPIICALMAHEKEHGPKQLWLKIIQFYTHQPSGFTIYNNYEVTWVTILQFIITSLSFVVVFETFRVYFVRKTG